MTDTATETQTALRFLFCAYCPHDCKGDFAVCETATYFAKAAVDTMVSQSTSGKVEWYRHHGRLVAVRQALRGHYRESCLCYRCGKFNPDNPDDNCPTANLIYAACVLTGVVTPIWECPDFG